MVSNFWSLILFLNGVKILPQTEKHRSESMLVTLTDIKNIVIRIQVGAKS